MGFIHGKAQGKGSDTHTHTQISLSALQYLTIRSFLRRSDLESLQRTFPYGFNEKSSEQK
jgi:hypothetical protein